LARGDRSRPERTTEERERDREERERRRTERNPGAQPPSEEPSVEPEAPPLDESFEPEPAPVEPEPAPLEPEPAPVEPEPESLEALPLEPVPFEPPTEPLEALPPEPQPLELEPEPSSELPPAGAPEVHQHPVEAPEPPASPPSRLGTPPPPVSERKRRARRSIGLPVVGAAASARRRPTFSRAAALIALGAALIAVIVAIVSLSSGSHSKAPALPTVVNILIPEGETRVQIAEIAKAKGMTGSYRRAAQHSALLNPVHYGAGKSTPDLEGFLFPATYELDKGAPAARLVEEQLTAFTEHFGPQDIAAAKALHVTPYELLTVASMVEREAQIPGDRAKIAAVIYNRLARGIPLGIDASIYYAVELEKGIATYTQELTEAQLHINSPYNTRTHTGLPPTPISNPGDASIHAAAHPAKVPYLYYVAAADGCGEQVFSDTQAQFETDAAAYKAAVAKNGGHPPSCKKK
jgi:UPF0755 protein